MYVFISFIGFVIEFGVIIIVTTRKCFPDRCDDDRETRSKEISVLVDYVLSSIGEFLLLFVFYMDLSMRDHGNLIIEYIYVISYCWCTV